MRFPASHRRRLPPGPKGSWLLGISPLQYGRPQETLTEWARQYGDCVGWRTMHFRAFLFNDPADIEAVLVTHNRKFVKGRGLQANRELFGNGLLTSEGDLWRRQRHLMQPAFHRDRLAAYGPVMVRRTAAMLDQWKDGEIRDVHTEMMRLMLGIAAETLFGVELDGEAERISSALGVLQFTNTSMRRLFFPLLRRLPTAATRRYARAIRELDRIVYGIIAERRARNAVPHATSSNLPESGQKDDLLARLLAARDDDGSRMSDRQLRDECITLLLAGHETTALAVSWTAYLLAQYPEVQERLHAEVDAALAGRPPSAQDVPRLLYAECILRESLRLYPPAWVMPRLAIEDCEIHGYRIRKGDSAVVSQWIVHRDPRYFPEPERFVPERWTEAFARNLPRFAYFPFGGGPRICIGNNFALLEATLVLASVAQRFHFGLLDSVPVEPTASITLRPKNGVRLSLSQRGWAASPAGANAATRAKSRIP